MESNFDSSRQIIKDVVNYLVSHDYMNDDSGQLVASIHPIVSNGMYKRESELLAKERMITIAKLARVVDDVALESLVEALGYTVIVRQS